MDTPINFSNTGGLITTAANTAVYYAGVNALPIPPLSGSINQADIYAPFVDDDELRKLVMNQLEFYFSRENLLHDKYLLAQMDTDQYVPIALIAAFNMIKKLFAKSQAFSSAEATLDDRVGIIASTVRQYAAAQLSQLQLDATGSKLRAHHKRCVVILREIDKDTPVDAILGLFAACSVKCVHCEHAGNRSWYLSFRDEAEAHVAVQFLKEDVQTFNGEALFARIKTLPLPRVSLTPATSANPVPKNNDINNNLSGDQLVTSEQAEVGYDVVDGEQALNNHMLPLQSIQQQSMMQQQPPLPLPLSSHSHQSQVGPPPPYPYANNTGSAPPAAAIPVAVAGYANGAVVSGANPVENYKFFNYYNQSK